MELRFDSKVCCVRLRCVTVRNRMCRFGEFRWGKKSVSQSVASSPGESENAKDAIARGYCKHLDDDSGLVLMSSE